MKTIYVGKNREYQTVKDALFWNDNKDLEIILDEGEYDEKIELIQSQSIALSGGGLVILKGGITVRKSLEITISNFVLKYGAVNIDDSENIVVMNNLLQTSFNYGIHTKLSSCNIENNTFISQIRSINIEIDIWGAYNCSVKNNIIAKGTYGIQIYHNQILIEENDIEYRLKKTILSIINRMLIKNLCFDNGINCNVNTSKLYTEPLEFEDFENNDFRLKDKKFKEFGASEELLLRYAKKFQTSEVQHSLDVYLNFSIKKLIEESQQFFAGLSDIAIHYIESESDIHSDSRTLLILNAFDSKDDNQVERLIAQCKESNKPFKLAFPSENYLVTSDKMNVGKMSQIAVFQGQLRENNKDEIIEYGEYQDVIDSLYSILIQEVPVLQLETLELSNIKNFSTLKVEFHKQATCFIGLNGTGKTTILRTLTLALLGTKSFSEIERNLLCYEMLQVKTIDRDGNETRENGSIRLTFLIDKKRYTNEIQLLIDERGKFIIQDDIQEPLFAKNLAKNLVLGFSQVRNFQGKGERMNRKDVPNTNDLLSILLNIKDQRTLYFKNWIAKADDSLIRKVFGIISQIAGKVEYLDSIQEEEQTEIRIKTLQSPTGIRFDLASQGYQDLIGWVGTFIQRLKEVYRTTANFCEQPAIVLVDEIDSNLHPQWQRNLLKVLVENFPNTQFIVSTHSPLVINNLPNELGDFYRFDANNQLKQVQLFGKDINTAAYEGFDVSERNEAIKEDIEKMFEYIENEQFTEAQTLLNELKNQIKGDEGYLLKAQTMLTMLMD